MRLIDRAGHMEFIVVRHGSASVRIGQGKMKWFAG